MAAELFHRFWPDRRPRGGGGGEGRGWPAGSSRSPGGWLHCGAHQPETPMDGAGVQIESAPGWQPRPITAKRKKWRQRGRRRRRRQFLRQRRDSRVDGFRFRHRSIGLLLQYCFCGAPVQQPAEIVDGVVCFIDSNAGQWPRHFLVTFATVSIRNRVMFPRSSACCQVVEIPSDFLLLFLLLFLLQQKLGSIRP